MRRSTRCPGVGGLFLLKLNLRENFTKYPSVEKLQSITRSLHCEHSIGYINLVAYTPSIQIPDNCNVGNFRSYQHANGNLQYKLLIVR